uniref:Uncharacterized protein n=1 Tax=Hyaloperonospora arabidopsidis (strain Emoy2) TaxID=559515 RepID=M4C595_HYAAE
MVVQKEAIRVIGTFKNIFMTLDGATNKAGKQDLNMMVCEWLAFFLMGFSVNLNCNTAANPLERLKDARHRRRVSVDRDVEDDVAMNADASRKEEPMRNPSTNSPRVMNSLRRKALYFCLFTFVFGCAADGGYNLSMDWPKLPKIKPIISANVFIVNKINTVHLLTSMFGVCCVEKLHKTRSLLLFTKKRWCTIFAMIKRNLLVKSVMMSMPRTIDHDHKFEDVAMEGPVRNVILDVQHWKKTAAVALLLTPLCTAITHLEGVVRIRSRQCGPVSLILRIM